MAEGQTLQDDRVALPVFYMKLTEPQVDARLGKLAAGKIRPLDEAKARRWLSAGIAEQVSRAEYDEQQDRMVQRSTAQQAAFQALNDGHALWDVSTYRDVLTAPESGLRQAYDAGIPLVNVHILRDENGDTLPPTADIEDILDARELMHPDLTAPLAAHDRSSVMGGGSPFQNNYGGPTPLSPRHRAMMDKVREQELYAQRPAAESYVAPDDESQARSQAPGPRQRGERGSRSIRRAGRVAPEGMQQAQEQGVRPPQPASGEQLGNAPETDRGGQGNPTPPQTQQNPPQQ
jgi:hypothetical protein